MIPPTAQQVAEALSQGDDAQTVALAGAYLPIVTALVREYTRGRGFDPITEGIAAVIITATARFVQNPELEITSSIDDYTVRKTVFEGLSLFEQIVLNNYRRRSA